MFRASGDWSRGRGGEILAGGKVGDAVGDGAGGQRWGRAEGEEGMGII